MQNRLDRIKFPEVSSEDLWRDVVSVSPPRTPPRYSGTSSTDRFERTPVIATTPLEETPLGSGGRSDNFLRIRKLTGLITPAATPSDILQRGPLYVSSSEEESNGSCGHESPKSADDGLQKRLDYHQERQRVIRQSISDFEAKMTELLDWHKGQERMLLSQLPCNSSRTSFRRGRSKLSERLYEAIDLNGG